MIIDLPVRPGLRILVTSRPVDFRRGMDSTITLGDDHTQLPRWAVAGPLPHLDRSKL